MDDIHAPAQGCAHALCGAEEGPVSVFLGELTCPKCRRLAVAEEVVSAAAGDERLRAENARLCERLAALEAAAAPFAEYAGRVSEDADSLNPIGDACPPKGGPCDRLAHPLPTLGDCRRLAALLPEDTVPAEEVRALNSEFREKLKTWQPKLPEGE